MSNRIEIKRWNPTMDGYTSVNVRVGSPISSLSGKMPADMARKLEDEIDRLYKVDDAMKEILEWRKRIVKNYLTKSNGCDADEWPDIDSHNAIGIIEEVFDAIDGL